jgi:CDP-diacylglycerol--glycerol-3-phosphate 3-phosphatidyltransferase
MEIGPIVPCPFSISAADVSMNLPNGLTVARIIVTPAIAALPFVHSSTARGAAFLLFLAAAISDWFDGYYARVRKQETDLGRMLDPLADKLLLVGTFVPMYFMSHRFEFITPFGDYDLPWWVVAIILGRELTMTWFRQFAARRGVVIAAIWPAKWKTTIQLIWSGAAYFWFYVATLMIEREWTGPISRTIGQICGTVGAASMLLAIAFTLYSLFVYMRDYGYLFRIKPVPEKPVSS